MKKAEQMTNNIIIIKKWGEGGRIPKGSPKNALLYLKFQIKKTKETLLIIINLSYLGEQ